MKLILVRHGETTSDIEDRYGGDYDDELTELGKQQAQELAEKIKTKGAKIAIIYSSPKKRALRTAQILGQSLGIKVKLIDNLRERNNYGVLSGLTKKEAKEKCPREVKELETNSPKHSVKNSERFEEFKQRIEKAFDQAINSGQENSSILLATHAGPMRRIVEYALKRKIKKIGHCGIIELERSAGTYLLVGSNGVELEPLQPAEIISNLKQIYETHSMPKNLRRHMIWVASVAEILCDNCKEKVDKESIIASCLIHDLGNLIKLDFDDPKNIALLEDSDVSKIPFFKQKKEEMRKKFGSNAEHANNIIAQELGVTQKVKLLVEHRPFEIKNGKLLSNKLEEVIAAYADLRVSPYGVVGMKERMNEFERRHKLLNDARHIEFSKKFRPLTITMEKKLFTKVKIKPQDITNESTKKYFEKYAYAIHA